MENQLWNLFWETGDPMSYLLYKAEKLSKDEKPEQANKQMPPQENSALA